MFICIIKLSGSVFPKAPISSLIYSNHCISVSFFCGNQGLGLSISFSFSKTWVPLHLSTGAPSPRKTIPWKQHPLREALGQASLRRVSETDKWFLQRTQLGGKRVCMTLTTCNRAFPRCLQVTTQIVKCQFPFSYHENTSQMPTRE